MRTKRQANASNKASDLMPSFSDFYLRACITQSISNSLRSFLSIAREAFCSCADSRRTSKTTTPLLLLLLLLRPPPSPLWHSTLHVEP
jgi:hypothetical protein